VRAEGGTSAHAVRAGLRAAGPEVTHGRLAPIAAQCGAILDSPIRAASDDGRELALALDDMLHLVARATGSRHRAVARARQTPVGDQPTP